MVSLVHCAARNMSRFASLTLLSFALAASTLAACASDTLDDTALAAAEEGAIAGGKADASWEVAPTHHVGERIFDRASAGGRRIYPVYLAGSKHAPVPLDIVAAAAEGDYSVRVAVLGPLKNGQREVLAAAGYSRPTRELAVTVDVTTSGEHLIVVGSHDLATETFFEVATACHGCDARTIDVLAEPKAGALVATDTKIVEARLGDVLRDRNYDVELELWASPPMQPWNAKKVATSVASGDQANVIVPDSVVPGDDLRLVVRKAGGAVLDHGVTTRYFPEPAPFVRTDAILYGDIVSLQIAGVVGFFEGHATLSLRSEYRDVEIAAYHAEATLPGAASLGFGAFDATFAPDIVDENGDLAPNLPRNGELLSVGFLNGNGDYIRLGCFEYCNDLSGEETCTGGPRSCAVASPW
jgi:hypothetical protein